MGGVGKTRLAVRVARDVRAEFDDGAWLVRLDLLEDPAVLAQAVAGTLGLHEQSALPALDLLAEYLAERRLLLLLVRAGSSRECPQIHPPDFQRLRSREPITN
jgi:non-specific serine/threonine protein kinase